MLRIFTTFAFLLILLFLAEYLLVRQIQVVALPDQPDRIISLSPAIAETLAYLDCADRIIGVTDNTRLRGHDKIPVIGKFRELNIEAILRTKPDLVILPADMRHFQNLLSNVNLPVLIFDTGTLHGYAESVGMLANLCRATEKGKKLSSLLAAPAPAKSSNNPTLLFGLLSPTDCHLELQEISIIGNDGFYNELISMTGARNIYQGTLPYPRLTMESIAALKPDIIILSAPEAEECNNFGEHWQKKLGLPDHPKIFFDYDFTIPGPSTLNTLDRLKQIVEQWRKNHA